MKALQDKCVANKGVIYWFCKCQEIENKEREQTDGHNCQAKGGDPS